MKQKLLSYIFQKISPWYVKEFAKDVALLPHEKQCASQHGPYVCNCAKQRIRSNCLFLISDFEGILQSKQLKEITK